MTDMLTLASRRRIFAHVDANAGVHLRSIGRACGLPLGTVLYHLDRLEVEGLVTARRDGRYKRYFPATGLGRRDKDLLSSFRHAVPRRVAATLLARGEATQRELCDAIGVSRSTLSFHVNQMARRQILHRVPARPENRYALTDPAGVTGIFARYAQSLGDTGPLRPPALAGGSQTCAAPGAA